LASGNDGDGQQRRRFSRLKARLDLAWKPRRPGESADRPSIDSTTIDLGGRGLAFATDVTDLEAGTYLSMELQGLEAEAMVQLEGVVTWVQEAAEDTVNVGVRILTPPEDGLHALMMATYDMLGAASCMCRHVRFCGALAEQCPAFTQDKNCWQVEGAACCYWDADGRDCTGCPVSILCFIE